MNLVVDELRVQRLLRSIADDLSVLRVAASGLSGRGTGGSSELVLA
jgi:hypothetical protein